MNLQCFFFFSFVKSAARLTSAGQGKLRMRKRVFTTAHHINTHDGYLDGSQTLGRDWKTAPPLFKLRSLISPLSKAKTLTGIRPIPLSLSASFLSRLILSRSLSLFSHASFSITLSLCNHSCSVSSRILTWLSKDREEKKGLFCGSRCGEGGSRRPFHLTSEVLVLFLSATAAGSVALFSGTRERDGGWWWWGESFTSAAVFPPHIYVCQPWSVLIRSAHTLSVAHTPRPDLAGVSLTPAN